MNTVDVDKYLAELQRKGREEGREEGNEEGRVDSILLVYQARFGAPPQAIVAALQQVNDVAMLQRLTALVASGSAEDVAAALRPARRSSPKPRLASSHSAPNGNRSRTPNANRSRTTSTR